MRTARWRVDSSIIWAVLIAYTTAESRNCGHGWFGRSCEYKCRCSNYHCSVDGQCLGVSSCQPGWFGPQCQYADLAYGKTEHPELTDGNDVSCLSGPTTTLAFQFSREYMFTWIQLVFRDAWVPDRIDLKLDNTSNFTSCDNRPHVSDQRVVEIHCRMNASFQVLGLKGHFGGLCSLHISGGRNIALQQTTYQSSTYLELSNRTQNRNVSYPAWKAVDGNIDPDFYGGNSCSRTRDVAQNSKVFWGVSFRSIYNVDRYVLYFSNNASVENSTHFITSVDERGTATFNGSVHGVKQQHVYTIINRSTHVNSVHIFTSMWHLDLCEVEVYGDSLCTAGQFGRDCERSCGCSVGEHCYTSSGQCYPGCGDGFEGEACLPCSPGRYGAECQVNCSHFCAKDHHHVAICHSGNGSCLLGCEVGYQPPFCRQQCDVGTFGPDCSSHCSSLCLEMSDDPGTLCDNVNGTCQYGCKMGYTGNQCTKTCSRGKFGYDCRRHCSVSCAPPADPLLSACNFTNGDCLFGCRPGFNGTFCTNAGDVHAVLQDVVSPDAWNTLYVVALCSALVAIALLMVFVRSKNMESFMAEENIYPDIRTR